jgi:hypothetical protein
MPARLTITIKSPGLLLGVRGIEILLDGQTVDTVRFGEACRIECAPGDHTLQARLRAVLSRRSNVLRITAVDGDDRIVTGRYSRMWGTLKLEEG